MCRLLGYAADGTDMSLVDVLGDAAVEDFRGLSEIHHDGWGCALPADDEPAGDDPRAVGTGADHAGGRVYRNTVEARHDPIFTQLSRQACRGALWHLRLASSHLPVIVENQQPFHAHGLSFIHNGDISDDRGRNIVEHADDVIGRKDFLATGGRSDSVLFFGVMLAYVRSGAPLDSAVSQAIGRLRAICPKSSYNCMIQSPQSTVVVQASGRVDVPPRICEIYEDYGREGQAHDYRTVRYREVRDGRGALHAVVAASSGFDQPEGDGWRELGNDHMLVMSNRDATYEVRPL
ncbi:MAG: class II glutamine amidotransferase [Bifidobacterium mongoliense]|nr:class II glutamine amidotransferase [Bifidobacterium mongoliense]